MSRTTYKVVLQADGNHKVEFQTDEASEFKSGLETAKGIYEWLEYYKQNGELHRITEAVPKGDAPVCPNHDRLMVYRQSKNGDFWSCPTWKETGCKYRP